MKLHLTVALLMSCCLVANADDEGELPKSSVQFIETLKSSGTVYTVDAQRLDYVRSADIPHLVGLLDSKEPCAHVVLATSSILPMTPSTVGHEAAYLIEGYWLHYYPPQLTSSQYKPDLQRIRQWFHIWDNIRQKSTPQDAP